MKRIIAMTAVGLFGVGAVAVADEVQKSEVKTEKSVGDHETKVKVEAKQETDRGLLNSTSDTAKAETDVTHKKNGHTVTSRTRETKHSAPGFKHDHETKSKETVETDASGKVVKDDVSASGK